MGWGTHFVDKVFENGWKALQTFIKTEFMPSARIFNLIWPTSKVPIPKKDLSGLVGREIMEGEIIRDKNSAIMSYRTTKDSFAVAIKIRATDREGNFIELTY